MQPPAPLVSGEGVALQLNRAGVGSRVVASLIDIALQAVAGLVLLFIDAGFIGGSDVASIQAVVLIEVVLLLVGYPTLCEWLGDGRTLGKRWLGLRVVRDDGGPISFREALVRALAGFFLEKPGVLGPLTLSVGLSVLSFNGEDKRIGDLLAGTVVVNERGGPPLGLTAGGWPLPLPLAPWATTLDLSRLDTSLALALRQFLARTGSLTPSAQQALGEELRARISAVTAPPPPPYTPTPMFLMAVAAERRRRFEGL